MRLTVVLTGLARCVVNGGAPIAQLAEAVDLKSIQCGFESHWGHSFLCSDQGKVSRCVSGSIRSEECLNLVKCKN